MSYGVTVRRTDGTIVNTSTTAYGSARPVAGDFVQLTIDGVTSYYKVAWASFRYDPLAGPVVALGAALPDDPPPGHP